MPDQLAHILFARRVLAAADKQVRMLVCADSAAFRAGTFGPDPLFNDPSPRRRAEGFEMHRSPGYASLDRMRQPLQQRMPWAADYAAGFFCHYALDRLCHPGIKALAAEGEVRHVALESAYDRLLYQRGNCSLPRRIALSRSALNAAAQMYTRVGAARYGMDVEAFWQIRRFVIFGGGTPIAELAGRIMPRYDGLVPHAQPSPATLRGMEMLDTLMEEGIAPAAQQLNLYFEALLENRPLDLWTYADFSGFQTQL